MKKLNPIIDKIFLPDYTVVFFHAHPDDESFLSAGLINELITNRRKCVVVFGAAAVVDEQEKTTIRQKEAIDACNILGVTSVLFLKFCEAKYSGDSALPLVNQKNKKISENLLETLYKNNIKDHFILVSYDKNGGYGNVDHKIIHAVGRDFQSKYRSIVPFLFEITLNRNKVLRWLEDAKKELVPQSMPKLSYWFTEFGLPNNEITHYYQLSEEQLKLKRKALAVHKTQIISDEFPLSLSNDNFRELFGCEFLKI